MTRTLFITHSIVGALCLLLGIALGFNLDTETPCPPTRIEREVTREETVDTTRTPGPTVETTLPVPTPTRVPHPTSPESGRVSVPQPTTIPGDSNIVGMDETPEVNRYTVTHRDSLLEATITADVDGELLAWDFEYTPNFPTITRTVTITDRTVETVVETRPPTTEIGLGLQAAALFGKELDPLVGVGPSVHVRHRAVSVGYTPLLPVSGASGVVHMVQVGVRTSLGL